MTASSRGLVIDASVTAAWLLPDEASAASRRAYARLRAGLTDAHAPELWLWECGNIIANAVKRRRMDAEDALLTWSVLDAIRTRVELCVLEPGQVRACLALALDHGLSLYDSAYLWMASSMGLPLLTHDRTLAAAAQAQGTPVITLNDLS